jgi:outer membrane protein, multidrug efflux system
VKRTITLIMPVLFMAGCTLGPNYKRPQVDVPAGYRGAPQLEPAQPQQNPSQPALQSSDAPAHQGSMPAGDAQRKTPKFSDQSLGDQKWSEVFQDPQLQDLIRTALKQNYDVRIAATRILEAQSIVGIARGAQLPSVYAGGSAADQRSPRQKNLPPEYNTSSNSVAASLAWDLDFWGKYRRATEAARANLLASEWARRQVTSTLVSNVASAYFELRAYDLQLEIAKRSLASRQQSLELTKTLADGGSGTMLDVRQAEQLVSVAAETIPDIERRIQQQENLISTLLGNNPAPIARGMKLTEQPHLPEVPAGIPSSLLERRPDIRAVEAQMIEANALIGVAKAAYFPDITLTATSGFQSSSLTSLFTGPAGMWNFGGAVSQPIFAGGRITSNVHLTEQRKEEIVLIYQQTIQQAFRGVSDSLIAYQKNREYREHQEQLVFSAQDAAQLSEARYRGGATNYLEVLTNETNALDAELGLAQAQANELLSLVDLYRNLGGGWEQ